MALDTIELLPAKFSVDRPSTSARRRRLRTYFDRNVMRGKEFLSSSWREWERSVGVACAFTEGQLSQDVGKHFDLTRGGRELRIVVIGQEVGGPGTPGSPWPSARPGFTTEAD